jgi:hypothetical protein
MAGRPLDRVLAWFGYGLVALRDQADERERAAQAIGGLEKQLQTAVRERAAQELRTEQTARDLAAEAKAHQASLTRLSTKIDHLKSKAETARAVQEKLVQELADLTGRNAEDAQAHAAETERLRDKIERQRGRAAAAVAARVQAEAEAEAEVEALRKQLDQARAKAARNATRLEAENARRKELLEQVAELQRRLQMSIDPKVLVKARDRLEAERNSVQMLKRKLDSAGARAVRLEAALKTARSETRARKIETDRARGDEQLLLNELTIETADAGAASHSGEHLDSSLARLSKARGGRRSARQQALDAFRLGETFQEQGAVGLAAACYRRVGPYLPELLAQEGPGGDRISGPDFLMIGAARAGTTWLKKSLSHHPQLFILSGEHHYFSGLSHLPPRNYVERFASSHARFLRPGTNTKLRLRHSERLYGEKSTTYLAMPQARIDLCAALYPKARLVCLVRDPAARAWSHLKHLKANGVLSRFEDLNELPTWLGLDELIRQGCYEEHLCRWARRYDPEQILLVDFDRIASEPEAVHDEVLAHIGAAPARTPRVMGDINGTGRTEAPSWIADHLAAAFEGRRFDVAYLRAAMERAAAAHDAEPPAAGRSPVRLAAG